LTCPLLRALGDDPVYAGLGPGDRFVDGTDLKEDFHPRRCLGNVRRGGCPEKNSDGNVLSKQDAICPFRSNGKDDMTRTASQSATSGRWIWRERTCGQRLLCSGCRIRRHRDSGASAGTRGRADSALRWDARC
jgi:hypothetical protein